MNQQEVRKKRRDKSKPGLEGDVEGSPLTSQSPFIRALGSTDFTTRAKGVQALTRFLQLKSELSEGDLLKVWKGLYVCFWHSDKAPVQEDLANRLVGILTMLNRQVAYMYFTVFMHTMRREWFNIDRLRLDKFLMLVRKFIGQMLTYLRSHDWDSQLLELYADFLRDHLLLPDSPNRASGLAYHICDIFVPELRSTLTVPASRPSRPQEQQQHLGAAVGKKRNRQVMQQQQQAAGGLPVAALEALLEPFSTTLLRATDQAMLTRVREAVFDPLIEELRQESTEGGPECADGELEEETGKPPRTPLLVLAGGEGLCSSFAAQLYELGGMPEVKARNRTALFGIAQALEKAQRKRAKRLLSDTASSPSLDPSPTHLLARHQQQQQQPVLQNGSSSRKDKRSKTATCQADAQSGPELQPEPRRPEPQPAAPAASSPKSVKKQRKAEAAAAAAWDEGGIGLRSTEASPTLVSEIASGSATKHSKKARGGLVDGAPGSPAVADFAFAFAAAGPSGKWAAEESSPGTPILGRSASKKDKKRKAEAAESQLSGEGTKEELVHPASASKSILKSGTKRHVPVEYLGVENKDQQQQQLQAVNQTKEQEISRKKHKEQRQDQASIDVEAQSSLQVLQNQMSAPRLKSALKHTLPVEPVTPGDISSASKEALKAAMQHRSLAADEVELKTASKSASKAAALEQGLAAHAAGVKRAHTQAEQQQQQQQGIGSRYGASTPPGSVVPAATAGRAEKSSSSGKKRNGQGAGIPVASARKAVRINLRKNLYFEHGGPIPDPMIRTPPTARSKGGILKRAESLAAAGVPSTPRSAPAKLQQQQQQQQHASTGKHKQLSKVAHFTPLRSPRAKAELFF